MHISYAKLSKKRFTPQNNQVKRALELTGFISLPKLSFWGNVVILRIIIYHLINIYNLGHLK